MTNFIFSLLLLLSCCGVGLCQSGPLPTTETRRYAIDVAGIRVGTMTATRQPQANQTVRYTLVSDVRVNFLVYKLKIYYKVDNLFQHNQLIRSTVNAHTNRGDYVSRTEWKDNHYEIVADQYNYSRRASDSAPITFAITNLYFDEPGSHAKAFAEYFGDYVKLAPMTDGKYRARLADREDEYIYENGQLTKIIKKNPLKNFVIKRLP